MGQVSGVSVYFIKKLFMCMSAQSYSKYMSDKSGEIQSTCQLLETQLRSHIELQENTSKAMGIVTLVIHAHIWLYIALYLRCCSGNP